ncbi:MAG: tetratricopeptide repeat protein, partial [Bacteroidia bacterium]
VINEMIKIKRYESLMKISIFLITILLNTFCSFAQQNKGVIVPASVSNSKINKTYALLIGIAKYEDPNMPQLQYADSDAVYFYRFLRSKTGGNVDSSHIRLLINKDACSTDIWRELNWILRRADSSDRVYIYFSGHGDAGNNQEEVYLLTHETARVDDPALYVPTSALPVINLKTKIKTLAGKNVEVILITDACRTNELPGKNKGNEQIYRNVMDENLGAVQITSCKANQMAQEGKIWGNGRGVFSFYLVNGLYGLADNSPADGKVDLEELESYVKENVKHDTRSLSTGIPQQVPVFYGKNTGLSKVDPKEKETIQKNLISRPDQEIEIIKKGSALSSHSPDSIFSKNFISAINEERLLTPEKNNAVYWLELLLPLTKDENVKADHTDILVAALMKKGQQSINNYSKGSFATSNITYSYFKNAAGYFEAALKYVKNNPEIYRLANASRLFLLARALRESDREDDWRAALSLADSSLQIYPWPYTYHTKAILFNNLDMPDSLLFYERKVIELAPAWSFAYNTMGNIFSEAGKYDSALYYYRVALKLHPGYEYPYLGLGNIFLDLGNYDSAIYYYNCSIRLNPKYSHPYTNLGIVFRKLHQYDSSIYYLKLSIRLNPNSANSYYALGNTYRKMLNYDTALAYYKMTIRLNPQWAIASKGNKNVFADLLKDVSSYNSQQIELSLNPKCWYSRKGLGVVLLSLRDNDSAIYFNKNDLIINPQLSFSYFRKGNEFKNSGQYDSAIFYYNLSIHSNKTFNLPYYSLATIYSLKKDQADALNYLELALINGFLDSEQIRYDRELDSIRPNKKFVLLLGKYFPEKIKK